MTRKKLNYGPGVIREFFLGDCRDIFLKLGKLKSIIDIIITDPPYNINFSKYNNYKDKMKTVDYINMFKLFKGIKSAIIQYPEEMMKFIVPALGVPNEVLAWCYPSNLSRQFRLINIYGTKPNFKKVLQPYKNPSDKRIRKLIEKGSKGAPIYDWFSDINIVKNVSKKNIKHPCPIPITLIERLLMLLTEEGDVVFDPFMGSGTTAIACIRKNRGYIGIEKDKIYYKDALKRIAND